MTEARDAWVEVGKVAGAHGVAGCVKVSPFSGDPSGLLTARVLRLAGGTETGEREFEVSSSRKAGDSAVFSLKGVGSPEEARRWAGALARMRRDELPVPAEGEFYWDDLVGCRVVDADGAPVGVVEELTPGPAHDWLVIRRGGEEALLPLVEAFVREVDVGLRRIVVSPPEGW